VIMFALMASIGTGVLLGILPAWQSLKSDLISSIRRSSSRLVSPRSILRDGFVALQLAISVLLLIGTGLFVRSLQSALRIDLGFNAENLAAVTVEYGLRKYDGPRIDALRNEVLERIQAIPGVSSAAWSQVVQLTGNSFTGTIGVQGQSPADFTRFLLNTVSAGYFQTMEIPLLRGRDFTKDDYRAGANVAMMLGDVLMPQRFGMLLLGFFSTVAVALSSIGLYGVVAYNVRQRYQEIGIRMALGAAQSDVLNMCVRSGVVPAMIGVVAGIAAAVAATRSLSAFLFGVSPTDIATFVTTAALLITVSAVASYLPARKATRIEPAVALRHE
jgi:hypothetical protein